MQPELMCGARPCLRNKARRLGCSSVVKLAWHREGPRVKSEKDRKYTGAQRVGMLWCLETKPKEDLSENTAFQEKVFEKEEVTGHIQHHHQDEEDES